MFDATMNSSEYGVVMRYNVYSEKFEIFCGTTLAYTPEEAIDRAVSIIPEGVYKVVREIDDQVTTIDMGTNYRIRPQQGGPGFGNYLGVTPAEAVEKMLKDRGYEIVDTEPEEGLVSCIGEPPARDVIAEPVLKGDPTKVFVVPTGNREGALSQDDDGVDDLFNTFREYLGEDALKRFREEGIDG